MTDGIRSEAEAVVDKWWLFVLVGILLVVLGIFAIAAPFVAGLAVAVVIGWAFLFAGVLQIIQAFWNVRRTGFWLSLLIGVFYFAVGLALLTYPVVALVSLTLLLGAFFLIQGILTILLAFQGWVHHKGWVLFNGIVTLVLALIILGSWPQAAAWVIGVIVGIELIFRGVPLIALGFALHTAQGRRSMRLAGGEV